MKEDLDRKEGAVPPGIEIPGIPARKLVKDPGPCRAPIAREAPGSSASLVEKRHLVLVDLISGFFLGLGGTLLTGTVCAFFHRGQRKVEMLGGLSP